MSGVVKIAIGVASGLLLFVIVFFSLGRPSSGWKHDVTTNAMTDEITAGAILSSIDGGGRVAVNCKNGGPLSITFGSPKRMGGFGGEDNYVDRMLRYRFDDGPIADTVAIFGDNYIGFSEIKKWHEPLISGLPGSRKLAIEGVSVGGENVRIVFDVTGAKTALERVKRECLK